jgi:hypothetical protein
VECSIVAKRLCQPAVTPVTVSLSKLLAQIRSVLARFANNSILNGIFDLSGNVVNRLCETIPEAAHVSITQVRGMPIFYSINRNGFHRT